MLAGGHVTTAGEVKGDLIAAGGEVSIGGSVGDDLYAAGGNVQLDAMVTGFDRSKKPNYSVKAHQLAEEKQAALG